MKQENNGNLTRFQAPVGVGVLTVLMVLLVLTLATFSVLTLASARADLKLSQVNADTVSAYYKADAEGKEQMADFAAGGKTDLESTIPMTDSQSLYIHLEKDGEGNVKVISWKTVTTEQPVDDTLNLWSGDAGTLGE